MSKYEEDLKNIELVWKIVKRANKLAKIATDASAAQKAMAKETANPSLREYKFGLEQAKERSEDSVAPASTKLQEAGKTCAKGLNPD